MIPSTAVLAQRLQRQGESIALEQAMPDRQRNEVQRLRSVDG